MGLVPFSTSQLTRPSLSGATGRGENGEGEEGTEENKDSSDQLLRRSNGGGEERTWNAG